MRTRLNATAWLTCARDGEECRFDLDRPEVRLGRSSSCDVTLADTSVSRWHATIERDGEGWVITDGKSLNGTFVNRQRVDRQRLRDGDEIVFSAEAPFTVTFHDASERVAILEAASESDPSAVTASFTVGNLAAFPQVLSVPGVAPHEAAAPAQHGDPGGKWMIGLFSQLGEALLATTDLDGLLEKILDVTFENLPAERGSVCLYDASVDMVTPKVTRRGTIQEPITISNSIVREVIGAQKAVLVSNAGADKRFEDAQSILEMKIHSAMCAPLYHKGNVWGFIYVDSQSSSQPFREEHLEVLTSFAVFAAVGVEQWRLREAVEHEKRIRSRLERYSSPAVVDQIVEHHGGTEMIPEQKEVTVLFADLQGFTAMSEKMEPGQVAELLNELFERLADVLFAHGGTLDKFTGDGLMAVFGAPLERSDHALQAISSALGMQKALTDLNRTRASGPQLGLRIGLNSGRVVAGDIGSPKRKDYSVLGDAVNVASRLESSVAQPGQVVVGPETYRLAKSHFEFRELPEIRLKGKEQPLRPYLVLRDKGDNPTKLSPASDTAAYPRDELKPGESSGETSK